MRSGLLSLCIVLCSVVMLTDALCRQYVIEAYSELGCQGTQYSSAGLQSFVDCDVCAFTGLFYTSWSCSTNSMDYWTTNCTTKGVVSTFPHCINDTTGTFSYTSYAQASYNDTALPTSVDCWYWTEAYTGTGCTGTPSRVTQATAVLPGANMTCSAQPQATMVNCAAQTYYTYANPDCTGTKSTHTTSCISFFTTSSRIVFSNSPPADFACNASGTTSAPPPPPPPPVGTTTGSLPSTSGSSASAGASLQCII